MLNGFKSLILLVFLFAATCKKEKNYEPVTISPGITFRTIVDLPAILAESSGIELAGSNQFYSLNDSKGEAELYVIDTLGELSRTIRIDNATNMDWEDLAKDDEGFIYIGDSGNNDNDRTDLKIYRIPSPATFTENSTAADSISFSYENQTQFPPPDSAAFFDSEAFFVFNDSIFLFIKDRSKPFEGKTLMYQIPAESGNHIAVLKGEFKTLKTKSEGAITSADISPSGLKVAMISKRNVWIFTEFTGTDFFGGKANVIALPVEFQMEGVVFADDCLLYLTNEKDGGHFSALHKLKICD
jgi:hypothetical protein